MTELVNTLATSRERVMLCKGLLDYRRDLRSIGVADGIQWIDGSFCEDVERLRGRPPGDIDLVTLMVRPAAYVSDPAWATFTASNLALFDPNQAKAKYGCHAFSIDLNVQMPWVVSQVTYWFGLFTHQKVTNLWKGVLQVPLDSDDAAAESQIDALLAGYAAIAATPSGTASEGSSHEGS